MSVSRSVKIDPMEDEFAVDEHVLQSKLDSLYWTNFRDVGETIKSTGEEYQRLVFINLLNYVHIDYQEDNSQIARFYRPKPGNVWSRMEMKECKSQTSIYPSNVENSVTAPG